MRTGRAGMILIATPRLLDPNFFRTVVLILQDDEEGSLGLVLNRATSELVADHLPGWEPLEEGRFVHYGGPVEPEVAIALGPGGAGDPTAVPGLDLVDLSDPPVATPPAVRIYSGYAGWGSGQLDEEVVEGSWYVVPASPDDPFDRPHGQWGRILRRQSGYLALVSTFPDDVAMN